MCIFYGFLMIAKICSQYWQALTRTVQDSGHSNILQGSRNTSYTLKYSFTSVQQVSCFNRQSSATLWIEALIRSTNVCFINDYETQSFCQYWFGWLSSLFVQIQRYVRTLRGCCFLFIKVSLLNLKGVLLILWSNIDHNSGFLTVYMPI